MSDVPAASFWTASLLLACVAAGRPKADAIDVPTATAAPGRRSAPSPLAVVAASGAAAGIAIAIRPNLASLAVVPAVIASWPATGASLRGTWSRMAVFGAACAPFVVSIAWFYNDLYGSPLQSGYGASASLYGWRYLRPNLARYPRWLWDTQGPLVFLFLLTPFVASGSPPPRRRQMWLLLAFIAAMLASYLWYMPYDAWWFLRFLLPALPLVFVLAATVVWQGAARFGTRARVVAIIAFTLITVSHGMTKTREAGVLDVGEGEQKYADVGRYVATRLPENAVVLAMQHSGSIRFYSGRRTLRYDVLEPGWLDRAVAYLRASGQEPYMLLEGYEVPLFRERFGGTETAAILDRPPMAKHPGRGVMLYGTSTTRAETEIIPVTRGCQSLVVGR
jgi:hypothetical protein